MKAKTEIELIQEFSEMIGDWLKEAESEGRNDTPEYRKMSDAYIGLSERQVRMMMTAEA